MESVTRTVYSSYLQTCLLENLPYQMYPNTTLNEKFNIQANVAPPTDQLPRLGFLALGNGGHTMTVGANGLTKPEPVQHSATDAALYSHLPFVMRPLDNDLSVTDRAKYALRRIETYNNIQYAVYYLKRIDLSSVSAGMELLTVSIGQTNLTTFVPTSANLNPTPPALSSSGINVASGTYVSATAKNDLSLTAFDIQELLNVSAIRYNDDSWAIVSELALVSGVDKVVQSPALGNTTINFNEVIAAQVLSFINTFIPAKFANGGAPLNLDVGSTEPLQTLA